ncbi:shikimate dehydrogenase [Klenkia terrae]|uniref:shikimate dehydrogenase n=1 Tax=Klenkia terrae TaxID=1052259 RepID=UPI003612621A
MNTVVLADGRAVGHNTDWSGFARNVDRGLPDAAMDRVVLLGAGGAGAAVAHALLTLGTDRLTVLDVDAARATELARALTGRFGAGRAGGGDLTGLGTAVAAADGLVHATPTGMAAHPGSPVPADLLRPDLWVADIVYRPLATELVTTARERGCRVLDGGGMAVFQAVDSFRLFTGLEPDADRMLAHFAALVDPAGSPLADRSTRRRAVATVCLSGTLEDKLVAAAGAGFDGIEVFEPDLVASPWSPAELAARCADLGLAIDLYQPFRDLDSTDPATVARNRRRARAKFDVMAALGVDTVLVCSAVAPDAVTDDDELAAQLHAAAELAGERGLRIAYEALAWGTHVSTWDHSWDLVRAADHPALGLCLDSFHVLSRGGDPAGFTAVPGDKLFFLQLADAPQLSMDVLQWSRHHRLFPGQGAFDLPAFLGSVLAAGYAGPLSLEVFNDVFRQSDPARTAVDAMRSLLALEAALPVDPLVLPPPRP